MLKKRSDMQEKMMHYIKMFVKEKNYPPSIREIGDALEIKSTSTVKGQLDRLRSAGYLTWEEGKPRTLRVIQ